MIVPRINVCRKKTANTLYMSSTLRVVASNFFLPQIRNAHESSKLWDVRIVTFVIEIQCNCQENGALITSHHLISPLSSKGSKR